MENLNEKELMENPEIMRLALAEASSAIKWYVTTMALAILSNGGELILSPELLGQIEGMTVKFNIEENEDGLLSLTIQEESENNDSVPTEESDQSDS